MVSFDSDNPTLAIPDFPVVLSPEPGGFDNFVFLGLVPETEIEGLDFLEEATTRIAAGGDKSESLALKPGRWGGDIASGLDCPCRRRRPTPLRPDRYRPAI